MIKHILPIQPGQAITIKKMSKIHAIRTVSGQTIEFHDESGKEKIRIYDTDNKNEITLDTANGEITIKATEKLTLEAKDIEIKAQNGIKIEAGQGLEQKANEIKTEAQQGLEQKALEIKTEAQTTFEAKATSVEINANASLKATRERNCRDLIQWCDDGQRQHGNDKLKIG